MNLLQPIFMACGIALVLSGCRPSSPVADDTPVAVVHDKAITAGMLRQVLQDEFRLRSLDVTTVIAEKRYSYEAQLLDREIDTIVLEHIAGAESANAARQKVDRLLAKDMARLGGEAALEKVLASQRKTIRSLRQTVYHGLLLETIAAQRHIVSSPEHLEQLRRTLRERAAVRVLLDETTLHPPVGKPASNGQSVAAGILVLALMVGGGWGLLRLGANRFVLAAWVIGCLLRFGLWAVTPFDVRGHDVAEHLDYLRHVANTWSIPDSKDGFTFYQPPLYYFICATVARGEDVTDDARRAQTLGLMFSIVTLAVGVALMVHLFGNEDNDGNSALAAGLLGANPALAFMAARVNNDTLSVLFLFAGIALLALWWSRGGWTWWLAVMVAVSLGLLTKSIALLLAAAAFVCLFLKPGLGIKSKLGFLGVGAALVLVLCGWLWIRRVQEGQPQLVASLAQSSEAMLLTHQRPDPLTFNPIRLIQRPFNHGWFRTTDRDHFWEYWFRSAQFGQFTFPQMPMAIPRLLVVTALVTGLFVLAGMVMCQARHAMMSLPFTMVWLAFIAGQMVYVIKGPFAAGQDFRYALPVLLPVCFFLLQGCAQLPVRAQRVMRSAVVALVAAQVVFLLLVIVI